ncbi:MAG: cell division protein FtsZ [Muribaculaceae bacterium]
MEYDNINDINSNPQFVNMDKDMPTIIKVIGVGGGGNNAINHMYEQDIKGVSFVVCNTDRQALYGSPVPKKVLIGPNTTHGLGAGNRPEVAREAAEESAEEIAALFDDDTRMVFITAGMGGGTGTGAAPVVARIAKEKGVLTIGIVTIPFFFEGEKKILKALDGADEMKKYVDALMVINNERLTEIYSELNFLNAFGKADDTLSIAARSISELITSEGRINLDFNDVNTTLRNGGVAVISSGYGEGERRVTRAIEDALNSPLLKNRDVYGSKRILVNIYFSRNAKQAFVMDEMKEMHEFMSNFAPEVDVIWGVAFDETLGEKIKVTILAAGFDVTLRNESPHSSGKTERKSAASIIDEPAHDGRERLEDIYGQEKVSQTEQIRARARYKVLTPDEFDDDAVIQEIEKNPTLHRDTKSIGKKPVATPTSIPTIISSDGSRTKSSNSKIVF